MVVDPSVMLLYDDDILAKTETRRGITRRAVVDVNRKGMMTRESKQDQPRAGYNGGCEMVWIGNE